MENEGTDSCTTTNMVLTLTAVPDIKNVTTVANVKNEAVLTATSNQYDNSDIKNSSEGSWHVVETWRVILSTIVVFPSAELLQSLHDIFDNVDDGKGNSHSESAKLRNIDTVHKIVSRISRRINRICRLLKRKIVSKHAAKLVPYGPLESSFC
jgi:hypothetical protein